MSRKKKRVIKNSLKSKSKFSVEIFHSAPDPLMYKSLKIKISESGEPSIPHSSVIAICGDVDNLQLLEYVLVSLNSNLGPVRNAWTQHCNVTG